MLELPPEHFLKLLRPSSAPTKLFIYILEELEIILSHTETFSFHRTFFLKDFRIPKFPPSGLQPTGLTPTSGQNAENAQSDPKNVRILFLLLGIAS